MPPFTMDSNGTYLNQIGNFSPCLDIFPQPERAHCVHLTAMAGNQESVKSRGR